MSLAQAYYPKSFPDTCLAEQDEFQALADNLTSCTQDSECTNVGAQYEAISRGQIQYVALKSCSATPVIASANREALEGAQRALLRARDKVQAACQPQGLPATCSAADQVGFQNDRYPAHCQAGVCTAGVQVE